MMSELLTIFTPTYNRAYLLKNLWKSLCEQKNKNFIWLIVDDGSTDGTHKLVEELKKNSSFKIQYAYQKNSGKHVAHNRAVLMCESPLFMCVDSDDILTPEAVNLIELYYREAAKQNLNIIGWCNRRGNLEGFPVKDKNWPKDEPRISCVELFEKLNFHGETALIWRTAFLKRYKFPIIPREKFVTEMVLYYQISNTAKLQLKNEIFYLFEYHNDGYTEAGFILKKNNPIGTAIALKVKCLFSEGKITRIITLGKYRAWKKYFNLPDDQICRYMQQLEYRGRIDSENCIELWIANILAIGIYFFIGMAAIKCRLKEGSN